MEKQELDFRKRSEDAFVRIQRPFDAVDPDVVECERALGSMTLTFADGSRCILSTQPSVCQLWLAIAARATAYHFQWDSAAQAWMDDKGRGVELYGCLSQFLKEVTGLEFQF
jgi:iron donor protein CyaY